MMNVNKGSKALNIVFAVFMVANIVKISIDLRAKYKKSKDGLKKL